MNDITITKNDRINILTLSPEISQSDYMKLRNYLTETLFVNGELELIIDCEQVEEVPSIAFGVFCSLARDIQRAEGKFCLIHVSDCIKDIMIKTHIDQRIKAFNTLTEAKKAFQK